MTVLSSKKSILLCSMICSAFLLPLPQQFAAQADELQPSRARVLQQLSLELSKQAAQYSAIAEEAAPNKISKANLDKLRPALNRQRQTLLSSTPLLGLLEPTQEEPKISHEVVGSLPKTSVRLETPKPMQRFRRELERLNAGLRTQPITILHLSREAQDASQFDSRLRAVLQKDHGNAGQGMVAPVRFPASEANDAYELTKAGRWRIDSQRIPHRPGFGLSARRATSRSSLSSMTITSKDGPFDWVGVTIATGPSQGTFTFKVGDVERQFDAHADQPGSRYFKLAVHGSSATVRPGGGAQTAILNWSMGRNNAGIRLVGFNLLSDETKAMERFDAGLVASDVRTLNPDLILLDQTSSVGTASKATNELIRQIRAATPRADIVYLGRNPEQIARLQKSCLSDVSVNPMTQTPAVQKSIKSAAAWTWSPDRSDICSMEDQLLQGLVEADIANLMPDYSGRRAAAFAKWLVKPTAKPTDLALKQPEL